MFFDPDDLDVLELRSKIDVARTAKSPEDIFLRNHGEVVSTVTALAALTLYWKTMSDGNWTEFMHDGVLGVTELNLSVGL